MSGEGRADMRSENPRKRRASSIPAFFHSAKILLPSGRVTAGTGAIGYQLEVRVLVSGESAFPVIQSPEAL